MFKALNIISIVWIYTVFRLGYNLGFGNIMADVGQYVTNQQHSSLSSLFNTFQQYSGTIGTNLMDTIIALFERINRFTQRWKIRHVFANISFCNYY